MCSVHLMAYIEFSLFLPDYQFTNTWSSDVPACFKNSISIICPCNYKYIAFQLHSKEIHAEKFHKIFVEGKSYKIFVEDKSYNVAICISPETSIDHLKYTCAYHHTVKPNMSHNEISASRHFFLQWMSSKPVPIFVSRHFLLQSM